MYEFNTYTGFTNNYWQPSMGYTANPSAFNTFGGSTGFWNTSAISSQSLSVTASAEKAAAEEAKNNAVKMYSATRNGFRKILMNNASKGAEGGLLAAMLGPAAMSVPQVSKIFTTDESILKMFYNTQNAEALKLFGTNPDLMTNAQSVMRSLDRKFSNDLKHAVRNDVLTNAIKTEKTRIFDAMEQALSSGSADDIAKIAAQAKVEAGVKNGFWGRLIRRFKGAETIVSREAAVTELEAAGKFSYSVPKAGTSVWRNMGGNTGIFGALGFAAFSIYNSKDDISNAYKIDKETGNKQLMQAGIKAGATAAAWTIGDAIGKTVAKRCLGKIAAKVATKIAVSGGCKLLGTAAGSVVPGVGTVVGLVLGTVADYVMTKYILPKVMPDDPLAKKTLESKTDEELMNDVAEVYASGKDIDKDALRFIKNNMDETAYAQLKKFHNMTDEERQTKLQEQTQQAEQAA